MTCLGWLYWEICSTIDDDDLINVQCNQLFVFRKISSCIGFHNVLDLVQELCDPYAGGYEEDSCQDNSSRFHPWLSSTTQVCPCSSTCSLNCCILHFIVVFLRFLCSWKDSVVLQDRRYQKCIIHYTFVQSESSSKLACFYGFTLIPSKWRLPWGKLLRIYVVSTSHLKPIDPRMFRSDNRFKCQKILTVPWWVQMPPLPPWGLIVIHSDLNSSVDHYLQDGAEKYIF